MTKHTRTAPPIVPEFQHEQRGRSYVAEWNSKDHNRRQRQADALLDAAAPLRYVPSMGKRLAASEWSDAMKRDARKALIAWNKP